MDATQKRLIEFVQRICVAPGRSRVIGLELVHCSDEGGASLIDQYPIDAARTEPVNLALQIMGAAQEHVECFPMPQRYAVLAYLEGEKEHCAQNAFLLRPQRNARSALGALTEPPTEKGLIAQLMRHTEAAYAANIKLSETIANMHATRAEQADTAFNRYLAERERWAGFSAEADAKAHERKVNEMQLAHDHDIQRAAMDELRPLLRLLTPAIGRKLVGVLDRGKKPLTNAPPSSAPRAPRNEEPEPPTSAPAEPPREAPTPREAARPASPPSSGKARIEEILASITEAEADKLAEVFGEERARDLVGAVLEVIA